MGGRATQPEVADRGPEPGVTWDGPIEEQLLKRQLALEDVALGEPRRPLDVERRLDVPEEDGVREAGRELGDPVDDRIAERLALVVPRAELGRQVVGGVLHEA